MTAYLRTGEEIYEESFRIIRAETNLARFPADVSRAVVRMVHAADATDIADDVAYGTGVWQGALQARCLEPLLPALTMRD
ncbi:MAG TPA: precorrin-8X methylmutase [Arachnia sp.]|nr:precorrin-8X methylmutase [Arachnia sp.]